MVSRRFEPPDVVVATLRGVLTSRDHAELLEWIRASVRCAGAVRLLITLEEFGGWHPGAPHESATSWLGDDEGVSKIAIIGDPAWKQSVLTFIAAPIRPLPIGYFPTEAAARRWLGDIVTPRHLRNPSDAFERPTS